MWHFPLTVNIILVYNRHQKPYYQTLFKKHKCGITFNTLYNQSHRHWHATYEMTWIVFRFDYDMDSKVLQTNYICIWAWQNNNFIFTYKWFSMPKLLTLLSYKSYLNHIDLMKYNCSTTKENKKEDVGWM